MLNWSLTDGTMSLKSQHSKIHLLTVKYCTEIFLPAAADHDAPFPMTKQSMATGGGSAEATPTRLSAWAKIST